MRRVASHYVYWNGLFRMHYVELDDEECLVGIYPLEGEIAGTEFYDGILFPVPQAVAESFISGKRKFHAGETKVSCLWNKSFMPMKLNFDACRDAGLPQAAEIGEPTCLLLSDSTSLPAAELGADDSRGDGDIQ